MFVFAHLFPDISIKLTKFLFHSWKNFSLTISLFFREMTAEVSRNNCANGIRIENSLDIFQTGDDNIKSNQYQIKICLCSYPSKKMIKRIS